MALKEKFLSYVEQHRAANEYKGTFGPDDPKTVDQYQKANQTKRELLTMIEELEK